MVGNDIVDLRYFESPLSQNPRYLNRVTVPAEAAAIRNSRSPVIAFSAVWAAKEAAFKLFSKLSLVSHFVPSQFISTFWGDPAVSKTKSAVVFGLRRVHIDLQIGEDWVHAVATPTELTVSEQLVEKIRSRTSDIPCPEEETFAARELAAKLLAATGLHGHALNYDRRVPFLALPDGTPSHMDISWSHHGRFAGVAIAARGSGTMEESCSTCMA